MNAPRAEGQITPEIVTERVGAVLRAREVYEAAEKAASIANNERSDALNRLNEAQRKLDALIDTMREAAPRDTDWGQKRVKRELVRT